MVKLSWILYDLLKIKEFFDFSLRFGCGDAGLYICVGNFDVLSTFPFTGSELQDIFLLFWYYPFLSQSVGLLLAMVDNQHEVTKLILPPLMKLGLADILINLLVCEVKSLYGDRTPDR